MAVPGVEDLLLRYPEFAEEDTGRLLTFLEDADLLAGDAWRDDHRPRAVMALAAHLIASDASSAKSYSSSTSSTVQEGVMTSKSVGPLSITTRPARGGGTTGSSASIGGRVPLAETAYGLTFLAYLRRSVPTSVMVV